MISMAAFSQYDTYGATATMFCKANPKTGLHERIDTLTQDTERKIYLAKDKSEFKIAFPTDGIEIEYKIYKKAKALGLDGKIEYSAYSGSDDEGYPLCLMISADEKKAILYYYYTEEIGGFSKSEKLDIKKE